MAERRNVRTGTLRSPFLRPWVNPINTQCSIRPNNCVARLVFIEIVVHMCIRSLCLFYCTALAVPANTYFLWRDVQTVHPLVGCQRSKNGTFDDSSLHRKNRNIATTSKYFIRLLIIGRRKTKVELDRVSNIWALRLLGKLALSSALSRVSGKNVFRALQVCN